jgi:hypothetical protein
MKIKNVTVSLVLLVTILTSLAPANAQSNNRRSAQEAANDFVNYENQVKRGSPLKIETATPSPVVRTRTNEEVKRFNQRLMINKVKNCRTGVRIYNCR